MVGLEDLPGGGVEKDGALLKLAARIRATLSGLEVGPGAGMVLAAAFSLLAFGLRLYRLEGRDIWWDEGWSVWLARRDLAAIALRTASDEHPPLHYWMLHFWNGLVGEGEFAVRFSSVFFGVLTIALLYRFGGQLVGRGEGLVAALLLATARFHVWWSQEIKMYALAVFLTLLSLFLFVRLVRNGQRHSWVAYLVVTLAALLTHYLTFLAVALENLLFLLWWLLEGDRRSWRRLGLWVVGQTTIALLYIPWLYQYLTHARTWQKTTFDPDLPLRLYATVLPLGVSAEIERFAPLAVGFTGLAALGVVAGIKSRGRWSKQGTLLLALGVLVVPLALWLFSLPERALYQPKLSERYMILFLPLYLLLLAQGVGFCWQRRKVLGALLFLSVLGVFGGFLIGYYVGRYPTYHQQALTRYLTSHWQNGDGVLLYPDNEWPVYLYYLGERPWYRIPYGARLSQQEAAHWLDPALANTAYLWVITGPGALATDPGGETRRYLEARRGPLKSLNFGRTRLTLYGPPQRSRPLGVGSQTGSETDGQGQAVAPPRLVQADLMAKEIRRGDTLYVFTSWDAKGVAQAPFRAIVSLWDASKDSLIARSAGTPLLLSRPSSKDGEPVQEVQRLYVRSSVPDGRYRVRLELSGAEGGGERSWSVGWLRVKGPPRRMATEVVSAMRPLKASFGGKVELLGYNVSTQTVEPGREFTVTLFWKALKPLETSYTVFVHLFDEQERVWASGDGVPMAGTPPTTAWEEGDVIEDPHNVPVGAVTPPGEFGLAIGWYDVSTGERLTAWGERGERLLSDRLILGTLPVGP